VTICALDPEYVLAPEEMDYRQPFLDAVLRDTDETTTYSFTKDMFAKVNRERAEETIRRTREAMMYTIPIKPRFVAKGDPEYKDMRPTLVAERVTSVTNEFPAVKEETEIDRLVAAWEEDKSEVKHFKRIRKFLRLAGYAFKEAFVVD
jgi:hypothetical protein